MNIHLRIVLIMLMILTGSCVVLAADQNMSHSDSGISLFVYCGAGLKAPMQEIGWQFENQTGTKVDITYAGSGALITQMNLFHKVDIFISGGSADYQNALKRGLVTGNPSYIAYHIPVIAVQKGNPKNIKSLEDFAQADLKVALADANATVIGRSADQMFTALNLMDAVNKNVVVRTATVNELLTALTTSKVDAVVITKDQVKSDNLEMIDIPVDQNMILIVTIGTTTSSKDPDTAAEFVNFVNSDAGKKVFADHGFPIYPDSTFAGVSP